MNEPLTSSMETGSHDAARDQLLRELDGVTDDVAIADIVARAKALHPGRDEEFDGLAAGLARLRGLRDPDRLGPYRVRRVLAVGGMGKLYEAVEDGLGRVVAVKTIKSGRAASPHLLDRFDRECKALAKLHHTHIVPIYSNGQESGLFYFSMPRIHGPSLRAVIRRASSLGNGSASPTSTSSFDGLLDDASADEERGQAGRCRGDDTTEPSLAPDAGEPSQDDRALAALPPDYRRRVAALMADVAEAVHHAHEAGVVHRDLKPANILVDHQRHPFVLDFGLAHFKEEAGPTTPEDGSNGTAGTDSPTIGVGTSLYWAPEQVPPRFRPADAPLPPPIDGRTDVWGLGVILYELLTLHRPFSRDEQICTDPPSRFGTSLPRELKAVCLKALAKAPNDRYPTALDLSDDLRRWVRREPTVAGRAGPGRRLAMWARRNPSSAALILVAALAALTIGFVLVQRAEAAERQRKREHQLLRLQELRKGPRSMGWYAKSWGYAHSLRDGGTDADPDLQAQAAAALEGFDARVVKSIPGAARAVVFDPRSERLLIVRAERGEGGGTRHRSVLWDRATDRTIVERDFGPGAIAFRPDGTPLQASKDAADRSRIRLFDVASGEEIRAFRSPREGPSTVAEMYLSRDGSYLAAVVRPGEVDPDDSWDGATTLVAWDVSSDRPLRTWDHKATRGVALSPDARFLAAWDSLGEVTVWSLPDGREFRRFRVGRAPVSCLAFGHDPAWHAESPAPPWLLAVGESSGLITVWDLGANRPRSVCRGSSYQMHALDFSEDGSLLVSAGRDPAKVWDVATGTCVLNLGVGNANDAIAFAPGGSSVAVSRRPFGPGEGAVELLELERGHGVRTLHGLRGIVEKVAVSPDGRLVAGASHEWEIGLWEWPSGRLRGVLPAPVGRHADSFGMAFDPDGRRFACSVGHEAQLWDVRSGQLIQRWALPEGLCDTLDFHDPGRLLLIRVEAHGIRAGAPQPASRVVRIYDLLGPNPEGTAKEIAGFPRDVHGIRLSPDGSVFLVEGVAIDNGRKTRRSHLYEVPSGKLVRELPTQRGAEFSSLAFIDPKGMALAVELGPGDPPRHSLFGLPRLTYHGTIDGPMSALNVDATQWLVTSGGGDDQPQRFILRAAGREQPLLEAARDIPTANPALSFSPDGLLLIAGNFDGTISVLDLIEMNRRLSELRLGW